MKKIYLFFIAAILLAGSTVAVSNVLSPLKGAVNTPIYDETLPSVTADGKTMYYLFRNPNRGKNNWDIYVTHFEKGAWLGGRPVRALNSAKYEGFPSISADGRTLFFSSEMASDDQDLYYSTFQDQKWSKPVNMGRNINYPGLDELGGSISPNGSVFVFSAKNRRDSRGKTDIYISYRMPNGSWGLARNIGRRINTKYREYAPYLAADGRSLYFSSDRKGGRGKMDLYKSVLKKGKWSKPKNLGKTINSSLDDIGISIAANGNTFYTSRFTRQNAAEIYTGTLPAKARPFKVILVKGRVYKSTENKSIAAKISIEDLDTGKPLGSYTSNADDGSFTVSLMEGANYSFTVQAAGFFLYNESYNLRKTGRYREEKLNIGLVAIKTGAKAVIKNIFFSPGSSKVDRKSRIALDRVATLIKRNATLKFEVRGHTDDRGGEAKNIRLSQARANNVVKYLVSKGVARNRLTAKGYGESDPVTVSKTTTGRAMNRRIEFFVLDN